MASERTVTYTELVTILNGGIVTGPEMRTDGSWSYQVEASGLLVAVMFVPEQYTMPPEDADLGEIELVVRTVVTRRGHHGRR